MNLLPERADWLPPEEYLSGEEISPVKHEYLGGAVYAMAGATNAHNAVATNALVAIGAQLRGTKCRLFHSDTKVRIQFPTHTRFYYPDAMVVCEAGDAGKHYQDTPLVIVEVLSEATRRTDEQEKREAYLSLPSLMTYVLLEQDRPQAVVWRRIDQEFVRETLRGLDAVIPLPAAGASLLLADAYEGVQFPP